MKSATRKALHGLAALGLLLAIGSTLASPQTDADRVRNAKALFVDRHYAEARQEFLAILAASSGADAAEAAFRIAYCSEKLGEHQRALREYDQFLARKPTDAFQVQEARTSRVGLAARLYRAGTREHLPVIVEALRETDKAVRYYAALQLADLDKEVAQPAVPVLKEIIAEEKDEDLVARAKARLLRIAPEALADVAVNSPPSSLRSHRQPSMVKVRLSRKGSSKAEVSVSMPLGFAELIFDSLPDDARRELRRKGFDADKFWKRLRGMAPLEILTIETDDGEIIKIWLE
jgi:tetratricopeptide (TPR) repeat protein